MCAKAQRYEWKRQYNRNVQQAPEMWEEYWDIASVTIAAHEITTWMWTVVLIPTTTLEDEVL